MKRILSACVEQIQRFESSSDCDTYLRTLNRKHVKYNILSQSRDEQGMVTLHIKREYNGYPTGDYLET